jgi:hypothetical protein
MMKTGMVLLFTAAVSAQSPTFKTRVHEVIVPVSVMTKTGKPIQDLHTDISKFSMTGNHNRFEWCRVILALFRYMP